MTLRFNDSGKSQRIDIKRRNLLMLAALGGAAGATGLTWSFYQNNRTSQPALIGNALGKTKRITVSWLTGKVMCFIEFHYQNVLTALLLVRKVSWG